MKYFILGGDASGQYDDTDFSNTDELNLLVEQLNDSGTLAVFNDLADPVEVLAQATGWDDYTEISEEEYNILSSMLIDVITDVEDDLAKAEQSHVAK